MFDADLRRPTPQVSRIGEGWNRKRVQRGRSKRREEKGVLSGKDGSVFPIQPDCPRAQPHDPQRRAVGRLGKASGKIEFQVSARACSGYVRPEHFDSDLRLTK